MDLVDSEGLDQFQQIGSSHPQELGVNRRRCLRGLGKGTWGGRTRIDAYIDKLRDEWDRT